MMSEFLGKLTKLHITTLIWRN